jgi:hypothetical protein
VAFFTFVIAVPEVGSAPDDQKKADGTKPAQQLDPVALPARERAAKKVSAANLKQIALAMHDYESNHGSLPPPAIVDKNGKPLLSWRVVILPFLKQGDLHKKFRLDEPWDSEANKKLLGQMPKVFGDTGNKTRFRVFVGGGAMFEPQKRSLLANVPDGTANTILFVEAAEAVEWTKPDELEYAPKQPLPQLGGAPFPSGFHIVMCNGDVHFVRKGVPEVTLRRMITRADGQVIDYTGVFDD